MNRYQDEDWQQEEQRRREAYYRMNSQNSNTPDALEQIFRGPLNWMNLLMIGINVVIFICLLYTSPSPRDRQKSRMPSSA